MAAVSAPALRLFSLGAAVSPALVRDIPPRAMTDAASTVALKPCKLQTFRLLCLSGSPDLLTSARCKRQRTVCFGWTVVGSPEEANDIPEEKIQLVLYTKSECSLCEGLEEKIEALLHVNGPNGLSEASLELRDIATNEEWMQQHRMEVPVLARVNADGSEEILPRFPPRTSLERMAKKLREALGLS